jgi:hypothetical protein
MNATSRAIIQTVPATDASLFSGRARRRPTVNRWANRGLADLSHIVEGAANGHSDISEVEICRHVDEAIATGNLVRARAILMPIVERAHPFSDHLRSAVSKFMEAHLDSGLPAR